MPGDGRRRRRLLLTRFGSLAGVRRATREELAAAVGDKVADAVLAFFAGADLTCTPLPDIDFARIFIAFIVLLFSLTVHETAHAWTADRLGDPTARLLGRVSLNPIVHADLIGTVLFPLHRDDGGCPDWLGEAGAGQRVASAPRTARLRARGRGRTGE